MKKVRDILLSDFDFLQPYEHLTPKNNGLDVEGMAYQPNDDKLWLGLRGPLVDATDPCTPGHHAVLLALNNALSIWDEFSDQDDDYQNVPWASPQFLMLGGLGIRDLYFDAGTQMYILAGKMGANTVGNTPPCFLVGWDSATGQINYCREVPQVIDASKENLSGKCEAEGICPIMLDGQKRLVVVYDSKEDGIYRYIDFPDPGANWDYELEFGTDTDGDEVPDGQEIVNGTLIFDAASFQK